MTISRTHKLVLLAAILIAAGSTVFLLAVKPAPPSNTPYYKVFKTDNGWGYNILVNEHIVIHQPFVPGKSGIAGFTTEQQAGADAQIVIETIKSGEFPLNTHQQLQRPGVLHTQPK